MGSITGFIDYLRKPLSNRGPAQRIGDYDEFHNPLDEEERRRQGARCMDCGVPFCQSSYGCPIFNLIPEWNDLVYKGLWREAFYRLKQTNNFPEFTGRVCPAPCESACVLGITSPAVTIKDNEVTIADRGYQEEWYKPVIPRERTGKSIAVIGSGPAGLAAAEQLNTAGHQVTVYERDDRIGGLLMYGIPNMKLDKGLVERRTGLMAASGIRFKTGTAVGAGVDPGSIEADFDAVLIAAGSTRPRDLDVPGRDLQGIYFAMDYLKSNTKRILDSGVDVRPAIDAKDKRVIVIGGGDTGNDCIGTAVRQGAVNVLNFELLPEPPRERTDDTPWPFYPRLLKDDYGHEEAKACFGRDPREYNILTKEISGDAAGNLKKVKTVRVRWSKQEAGHFSMEEMSGSEQFWEADMVFLAMGFLGPPTELLDAFSLEKDSRSNILAPYGSYMSSRKGIFAAGDARRGQSLVVWAIHEGREAAREIDRYLMGDTVLP